MPKFIISYVEETKCEATVEAEDREQALMKFWNNEIVEIETIDVETFVDEYAIEEPDA